MRFVLPLSWLVGLAFSTTSLALGPEYLSSTLLALMFLFSFTFSNKVLLFYKRTG
jgi:hypothetical protein